jgi:hypothetical protein
LPQIERRECPPCYQDRLTRAVGKNQYGDPFFKIAWGQTATYQAGGVWPHDHLYGYRQLMLSNSSPSGKGQPCWMILEWHSPQDYETPGIYYFRNRDDLTGLQILGEYPYRGRYEVAFKLTSQEYRNGRMEMQHYHLDDMILDLLIPCIVEGQNMTMKQRLKRLRELEEAQSREEDRKIDAMVHGSKRRLLPSQIDDRVRLIQQQMSAMLNTFGRVQPGFKTNSLAA